MRVIIAGSRYLTDPDLVSAAVLDSCFNITTVISGGARGVDRLGEDWARSHGIPVEQYPAQWRTLGRGAGFARNRIMAQKADALIAVWDGVSTGTENMIYLAGKLKLRIYIHRV